MGIAVSTFLFVDLSNLKITLFISFIFCMGQINAGTSTEIKFPPHDAYFSDKSIAGGVVKWFCLKCEENKEAASKAKKDLEKSEEDKKKLSEEVKALNDINDEKTTKFNKLLQLIDENEKEVGRYDELVDLNQQWNNQYNALNDEYEKIKPELTNLKKDLEEKDKLIDTLTAELTRMAKDLYQTIGRDTSSCSPVGAAQREEPEMVKSILYHNELLQEQIKYKDKELGDLKRAFEEKAIASSSFETPPDQEYIGVSVVRDLEKDMVVLKEKHDQSEKRNVELQNKIFELNKKNTERKTLHNAHQGGVIMPFNSANSDRYSCCSSTNAPPNFPSVYSGTPPPTSRRWLTVLDEQGRSYQMDPAIIKGGY